MDSSLEYKTGFEIWKHECRVSELACGDLRMESVASKNNAALLTSHMIGRYKA
jgi:hypothetical protein